MSDSAEYINEQYDEIQALKKDRDHLRRALEKACEWIDVQMEHSCPCFNFEDWERDENCIDCVDTPKMQELSSSCWLLYFMEDGE